MSSNSSLTESLHEKTIVFGLKLWVVIGIAVGVSLLGIILILLICFSIQSCIKRSRRTAKDLPMTQIPSACKDIKEVGTVDQFSANDFIVHDGLLLTIQSEPKPVESVDREVIELAQEDKLRKREENNLSGSFPITDDCNAIQTVSINEQSSTHTNVDTAPLAGLPEFSYLGWGHWFTLRDLELATSRFSKDCVIGEGGYGVVYRGRLPNGIPVAVKKILNNL
jgi:hypothetical protein